MAEHTNSEQTNNQGKDNLKNAANKVINNLGKNKGFGKDLTKKTGKAALEGLKKLLGAIPPQIWAIVGGVLLVIILVCIIFSAIPFGSLFLKPSETMAEKTEKKLTKAYNIIAKESKSKIRKELNEFYNLNINDGNFYYNEPENDKTSVGSFTVYDEKQCLIQVYFNPGPSKFVREVNAYANAFNGTLLYFKVGEEAKKIVEEKVEITEPFTTASDLKNIEKHLDNPKDNEVELTKEGKQIIDDFDSELADSDNKKYYNQIQRNADKIMYVEDNADEWTMPNSRLGVVTQTTVTTETAISTYQTETKKDISIDVYDPANNTHPSQYSKNPQITKNTSASTSSYPFYPYTLSKSTTTDKWNIQLSEIKVYMSLNMTKYMKYLDKEETIVERTVYVEYMGREREIRRKQTISFDDIVYAATGVEVYKEIPNEETGKLEVKKIITDEQLGNTYAHDVLNQYYFGYLSMFNNYSYISGYPGEINPKIINPLCTYKEYISQENTSFTNAYWNYSKGLYSKIANRPYQSSFNPGSGTPIFTGQCTQFAATMFYDMYGFSALRGDGLYMAENLINDCGETSDAPVKFAPAFSPAPGAVVSLSPNHVIIVDQVDPDGTIYISEGNLANHGIRIHYKLEGGLAQYEKELGKHVEMIAVPIYETVVSNLEAND